MLNISHHSIRNRISLSQFKSGKKVSNKNYFKQFNRLSLVFLVLLIIVLFLPWTQNISGKGYVTTLKPSQRPQYIQSPIPGRIEVWFAQEGQLVQKGDTILKISEIKSDYFDSQLVVRTGEQLEAKTNSIGAYKGKVKALENQIRALQNEQVLKQQQAKNKMLQARLSLKRDSIDLKVYATNLSIAKKQLERVEALYTDGLKAAKEVEAKRLKYESNQAKYTSQENKLLESSNKLINAQLEQNRITASYRDKISKAESDLYTAQSLAFGTQAEVSKLANTYANYQRRKGLQYITAPQTGYINKALKAGIGETFKSGESLLSIMPANYELAVETYVLPIDLPLLHRGEKVRVQFDGWPAIVFSGWESISYGTYGAIVVAKETFISPNGMYRVLLAPDPTDHAWPSAISIGSGAKTIALLEDVPIWYEIWRQLNGFPNNFYQPKNKQEKKKKNA
ncbi:MAG: HlyD family secretion protein [Flavobacteriaceae bacterium]|nr:HlyD family secretion protein [Flavobacteriaceae bacterium]